MPDSVMSIGDYAFCATGHTSMTIPNSVTHIGWQAFAGSNLLSMTFSGKNKATVIGLSNYSWELPFGCVLHCTDGDITI
jgi:hypothetical protein